MLSPGSLLSLHLEDSKAGGLGDSPPLHCGIEDLVFLSFFFKKGEGGREQANWKIRRRRMFVIWLTKWFSSTRLETRTKESNIYASIWVMENPDA